MAFALTVLLLAGFAPISPGSSGGPVVLASGDVIGVAPVSRADGQPLNFAVPANAVRALIDRQAGAVASPPPPPSKLIPAVVAALEESKFRYQKASEGVWLITFAGDNSPELAVYIKPLGEMVVISSLVQKGSPSRGESLKALLQASYEANFAKLALEDDGDVFALTELPQDFTAAAFKAAIDAVASLADKAILLLGAARVPTAETETIPTVAAGRGATLPILRGAFELSYDPAKWRVKPSTEPGEAELMHVSGDAYLKVISERIEIAAASFRNVVLENAKPHAPDIAVVGETPRVVNGLEVVVLRYAGTTSGIKMTYYNQIFSDTNGTIQLAGYTGTNLFDEYQRDFLELFAGLRKVR